MLWPSQVARYPFTESEWELFYVIGGKISDTLGRCAIVTRRGSTASLARPGEDPQLGLAD